MSTTASSIWREHSTMSTTTTLLSVTAPMFNGRTSPSTQRDLRAGLAKSLRQQNMKPISQRRRNRQASPSASEIAPDPHVVLHVLPEDQNRGAQLQVRDLL